MSMIGAVGLVVILVLLVILNARYLVLWVNVLRGRKTLREQRSVLPGPLGLVAIGAIILAICVIEGLLNGEPWYRGLLLSDGRAEVWAVNSAFLILGYLLVIAGIVSLLVERKSGNE